MRSKEEIQGVLNILDVLAPSKYSGMTYENGVDEALMWVIGDIDDSDFSLAGKAYTPDLDNARCSNS